MRRQSTRIVIIDDRPLVCESLKKRINAERDLEVCGQAGDRAEALQLVKVHRPDLVVVNLRLGAMWGVSLVHELRTRYPGVVALVVSMFDSYFLAERAMKAGARGFITLEEAPKVIIPAIRQVLGGEAYLSPSLTQTAATRLARGGKSSRALGVSALSDRELQVFELAGVGLDSRRIAEAICLDISTVDTYRARIKSKLRLQSASEFLQGAITWVQSRPTIADRR